MSLIVTVIVKDAIIMTSDSRTTYIYKDGKVSYSDHANKTYLFDGRIGISTCRNAKVNDVDVEMHLADFEKIHKNKSITRIPRLLKEYFINLDSKCDICFLVGGYEKGKPYLYLIYTQGEILKCESRFPAAIWEGEKDIPSRLFTTVYVKKGTNYTKHCENKLNIDKFSILDGIEYAKLVINTAKNVMKFQDVNQTIGGAIDVLILKEDKAFWYEKK